MENFIVCGIHTDCGKSVVSVLLYQYLKEKYGITPYMIKPVQTGKVADTDFYLRMKIKEEDIINFYTFKEAISPHIACKVEKREIDYYHIIDLIHQQANKETKPIVLELAGGIFSPITDDKYMIDFIKEFNFSIVLVVNDYIGAINHALLTLEALEARNIKIKGIIYNCTEGDNKYSEEEFSSISSRSSTKVDTIYKLTHFNNLEEVLSSEKNRRKIVREWKKYEK